MADETTVTRHLLGLQRARAHPPARLTQSHLSCRKKLVQTGSRVRDYGWPMWCLGRVWDSLNCALHGGMRGCA